MKIEEDLKFWYHLYADLARLLADASTSHWNVKRKYQVDGETFQLLCLTHALENDRINMTFVVTGLYRLSFEVNGTLFLLGNVAMDAAYNYAFSHDGLSDDEFEYHMTMLKLQSAVRQP